MQDPHPKLLVMAAALMCSGAMGLPVSGYGPEHLVNCISSPTVDMQHPHAVH